jgi:hypothetical protein
MSDKIQKIAKKFEKKNRDINELKNQSFHAGLSSDVQLLQSLLVKLSRYATENHMVLSKQIKLSGSPDMDRKMLAKHFTDEDVGYFRALATEINTLNTKLCGYGHEAPAKRGAEKTEKTEDKE